MVAKTIHFESHYLKYHVQNYNMYILYSIFILRQQIYKNNKLPLILGRSCKKRMHKLKHVQMQTRYQIMGQIILNSDMCFKKCSSSVWKLIIYI